MKNCRIMEVYSPAEVCALCNTDMATVQGWIEREELDYFRIPGGHYRVRHRALDAFLSKKRLPKPENWQNPPEKFRVLVVEDDNDLLEIVTELLKDEPKLEVKAECNGFNAGLQIAGWYPDLILLDFLMPGVSGFEICSRLRENEETKDIPVLAITSLSTRENRRAVYESGVSDFLGKPFYSEALLHKVRILLGIHMVSDYSPPQDPSLFP